MHSILLKRNTNQALELAKYAKKFMSSGQPSIEVLERTKLFHTDSVICGLSALALKTNAPTILQLEAMEGKKRPISPSSSQKGFALPFGSDKVTDYMKAVAANCSAVREWDSNGTVFGYRANHPNH